MKTKFLFVLAIYCSFQLTAQTVTVPDNNFKAKLLQANTGIQIARNLAGQWFKIDANNDGQIQTTEAQQVSALYVNFSNISNITGIDSFTNLKVLSCYNNTIASINVAALSQLQELYCYNNSLTSLVVIGTALKRLDCFNNLITELNISSLNTLEYVDCKFTPILNLNASNLTHLETLLFGSTTNNYWYLQTLNISGCTNLVTIPEYLQEPNLTNLNVSNCTSLLNITITDCQSLTTFNVQGCSSLQSLTISSTALSSLDLTGVNNLVNLSCRQSQLTSLNVSGLTNLSTLDCKYNQLPTLDLTGLTNLTQVQCSYNQLLSLNLSGLSNLNYLECNNNQLLSLDLSECYDIGIVYCGSNQILSLFIKNGKHESIDFSNNPIMLYICTDENEMVEIQNTINQLGYVNCQVNTYCSFVPGGVFYTIQGTSKIDINANGCDASDASYANLKYDITDGTLSGSVIADTTGNYSIPVTIGTHTVTPVIENPSYFTVSPSNVQVNFPSNASPFTQDFCIAPNGNHPDLEITIICLGSPIPGFNVSYKIVYKNKGNQMANGQITLAFDDSLMDFLEANPAIANQATGLLTWDYTNLQPFESRSINFSMNLNAPTDTPPLNGGDTLIFTAIVNPVAGDETATDNHFDLNQSVYNSFDPNDKICLEGSSITPAMVGKYIHYKIRFENTGNYPAQNIVVKDLIDTTMFDLSTLQITDSSNPCIAAISNGNKVEFIFENINLPIDDANNDGYVVFKIKTKSTVVLGDILKNQADIYFDYNFPVTTNEVQTVVQNPLSNQHFDLTNIKVYPNPVRNLLNIQTSETITKAQVFDTNGRLILSSQTNNNQVDLSTISSGVYFVKVYTNDKIGMVKVTKE